MMNYWEHKIKKEKGMEGVCGWGCNWQHGWNIISNKCENLRHLDYTNFLFKMSIGSKTKIRDCYPWKFYLWV